MNYQVFFSGRFDRDSGTKEIVRSYFGKSYDRFYNFLRAELENFDPRLAITLGQHLYKKDLSPPGFNKGKRNAYRLIIAYFQFGEVLAPVVLYKKSNISTISKQELMKVLEEIVAELQKP